MSTSKMKNIKKKDIYAFLDNYDSDASIMPVILDEFQLSDFPDAKQYIEKFFSCPERFGKRCVISSKCMYFIKLASEVLGNRVIFVNDFLVEGIQNQPMATPEITIYILPDFSFRNLWRSLVSISQYINSKQINSAYGNYKRIRAMGIGSLLFWLFCMLPNMVERWENISDINQTSVLISRLFESLNLVSIDVIKSLALFSAISCTALYCKAVCRNLDKECANAVNQTRDNVLFLAGPISKLNRRLFDVRWLLLNQFYRTVGNCNTISFCIAMDKSDISAKNMEPFHVFHYGDNPKDVYRYLMALIDYFSFEKEKNSHGYI